MIYTRTQQHVSYIAFVLGICALLLGLAPSAVFAYSQGSYYAQGYYQSYYQGTYSVSSYYHQGSYYSGGVTAGTQTYATPGSYTFTVPTGVYAIRAFAIGGGGGGGGGAADWGGGGGGGCAGGIAGQALSVTPGQTYSVTVGAGGGGGGNAANGASGGVSRFNTITAAGGSYGGKGYYGYPSSRGANGGSGGGSGGGGGGNPYPGFYAIPGHGGGAGAQSGSAGSGGMCTGGGWGISPASYITNVSYAEGAGGWAPNYYAYCGGGGGGGIVINSSTVNGTSGYAPTSGTWGPSCAPNGGAGYGGGGGGAYYSGAPTGGAGAAGAVYIEWAVPPTCSITFDTNPASYGVGTTMNWSSEYADGGFTISNVGAVTPNTSSSAHVEPTTSTTYTGTVWNSVGVSNTCSGTLTISTPAAPTATITSSAGSTMNIGQSSTITATYAVGSGDTLTAANIDSPVGSGLAANTSPGTKTYTFTPTSAGTYVFYARATTSYYPSWATYGQTTVTVLAPCTVNGTTLQSGESATFYSSQTSGSGQLCSSLTQSRTCTDGVLSGSDTYQYASCSCTPTYSCSGNNIQYTNSSCSTSTTATCVAPSFCSAGSSVCLVNPVVFNETTELTGHLQVAPSLVISGTSATIYWDISNAACTVTGNGDTWTTDSGAYTSSPIFQQTTYTFDCTGDDGSTIHETATINIIPVFQEL